MRKIYCLLLCCVLFVIGHAAPQKVGITTAGLTLSRRAPPPPVAEEDVVKDVNVGPAGDEETTNQDPHAPFGEGLVDDANAGIPGAEPDSLSDNLGEPEVEGEPDVAPVDEDLDVVPPNEGEAPVDSPMRLPNEADGDTEVPPLDRPSKDDDTLQVDLPTFSDTYIPPHTGIFFLVFILILIFAIPHTRHVVLLMIRRLLGKAPIHSYSVLPTATNHQRTTSTDDIALQSPITMNGHGPRPRKKSKEEDRADWTVDMSAAIDEADGKQQEPSSQPVRGMQLGRANSHKRTKSTASQPIPMNSVSTPAKDKKEEDIAENADEWTDDW
ncbi:hypothetical protein BZG36_01179 [Bifiguratus adelaidae]|uniref:Uncharacterized protein n=1 Tax=Bifiguratus adelaidae TaxID=1938954 RepID=A0A261Y5L0_9FUNG|nr:hypothetical protein BZG36_01179 [Bifiguratus adelaidae]